jgi:hypothetical protein
MLALSEQSHASCTHFALNEADCLHDSIHSLYTVRSCNQQLKTHTNQYFTMLIDVVARYGGDIIKFCGDAVMVSS